jgi:MoxR-like ATPase
VTSEDIAALAHPVLRHRIIPTFNADAEGITVNHIIDKVLQSVPQQPVAATL